MKFILYFTSDREQNGLDFLNNYGENEDFLIKKMIGSFNFYSVAFKNMGDYSHIQEVVIDRTSLQDDDEMLLAALEEFMLLWNVRITLIYKGLSEDDTFFKGLLDIGVGNIITAKDFVQIKRDLKESMSDNGLMRYKAKERKKRMVGEWYDFECENVSIVVVGSQGRIGTTTFALALSQWIQKVGGSVCFLDSRKKVLPFLAMKEQTDLIEERFQKERITYSTRIKDDEALRCYNKIVTVTLIFMIK